MKKMLSMGCLAAAVFFVPCENTSYGVEINDVPEDKAERRGSNEDGARRKRRGGRDEDGARGDKRRGRRGADGAIDRRGMERMLKSLNLTKEQKATLKKNREAHKAEMKKYMDSKKKSAGDLREKMKEARKNKDREAMRALNAERKELFKDAPKRNGVEDLKKVLTSEQSKKLDEMIAKRKAEMEKRKKEAKGKKGKRGSDADGEKKDRRGKKGKRDGRGRGDRDAE